MCRVSGFPHQLLISGAGVPDILLGKVRSYEFRIPGKVIRERVSMAGVSPASVELT
jgi:hypothetical protein